MTDFWARRKEAVAKEAEAERVALQVAQAERSEAELAERSDEELLAEQDLPLPEELDSPEAVRDFLTRALPQRLKTRALRKLWTLNPVLANLDGLVDYGEDFTDSATVIENLQTAYQVGKGMLAHVEEMARQAEAAEQPEAEPGAEPEREEPEVSDPDEPVLAMTEQEVPDQVRDAEVFAFDEAPLPPAAPRRMQFRFDAPSNIAAATELPTEIPQEPV